MQPSRRPSEAQATKRKEELINLAAIENLRAAFGGKKSKPIGDNLQDKIGKACKCNKTMAAGLHKENGSFHPLILKSKLKICRLKLLSGRSCNENSMSPSQV